MPVLGSTYGSRWIARERCSPEDSFVSDCSSHHRGCHMRGPAPRTGSTYGNRATARGTCGLPGSRSSGCSSRPRDRHMTVRPAAPRSGNTDCSRSNRLKSCSRRGSCPSGCSSRPRGPHRSEPVQRHCRPTGRATYRRSTAEGVLSKARAFGDSSQMLPGKPRCAEPHTERPNCRLRQKQEVQPTARVMSGSRTKVRQNLSAR